MTFAPLFKPHAAPVRACRSSLFPMSAHAVTHPLATGPGIARRAKAAVTLR
ncbi:hypothetical protein ACXIVK_34860 [Paraburkholderia caledonica]